MSVVIFSFMLLIYDVEQFYFFSFKFNQASRGFIYSKGPHGATRFYLFLMIYLFIPSFLLWPLSVLKPSWHHLWIFGWWACGQARLWWEASRLCSNLGSRPYCSRTSIWFLTSLGLGFLIYWFYLVLHIVLKVFGFYSWFMAL